MILEDILGGGGDRGVDLVLFLLDPSVTGVTLEAYISQPENYLAVGEVVNSSMVMDDIVASNTALSAIMASNTALSAIMTSSTAMSAILSNDNVLKTICLDDALATTIASSIQEYRDIIISTLDASSLFAKTTTTFSQSSSTIKTELADTNTIIIPIQIEAVDSSNNTRYSTRTLWYSDDTSYEIFSFNTFLSDIAAAEGVSMRGITHRQSYGLSAYYSKPTCNIYTVI